jgi:1-acyl-sn-glycerol-3-phosphate acyltransferase
MQDFVRMFHRLRSVWIWTATVAVIVAWVPLLGIIRLFDRDPLRLRTARWYRRLGPLVAAVNPWRVHISGLENLEPGKTYVIVINHQSLADVPLVAHLVVDAKWVAKAELFRLPALGWMLRMSGDIPVERADSRKAAKALLQSVRYLRKGCSVLFFPEGTRSPDGEVLPFNDGPFQLAVRENVPVLPVVVEGSGNALPRNTWIFGGVLDVHLRVLEAVPIDGRTAKQSGELRDTVRQKIIDELHRMRSAAPSAVAPPSK